MDYIKYVNIKQGSDSSERFSNGNTLPLIQRPFGFASFSLQTNGSRGGWFYHPKDRSFEGIRLTHQPSPWIGEHGAILIHTQSETPSLESWKNWSSMDPGKTLMTPAYLRTELQRVRAEVEMTPTEHGALFRFRYHSDLERYLSVLPVIGRYSYSYDEEKRRLYARTDGAALKGYDKGKPQTYFVFSFREGDLFPHETLIDGPEGQKRGESTEGEGTGIHLKIRSREVIFSVASSYISFEQAERNLQADSTYEDFDSLRRENEEIWNSVLGRIEVQAEDEILKTFYSCLYRVFLFPHKAFEVNEKGEIVHYSPQTDDVRAGYRYTDNGFWDTYRTIYPLLRLIAPVEYGEMLRGFLTDYLDGGWLPCWTAMDAKKCMPSTMIDAVLADAVQHKMLPEDLVRTALQGMEKHANMDCPIPAYGREGCGEYLKRGYVPADLFRESVNLTLDASYGDYCISVLADALHEKEKAEKYRLRSKNYQKLFDPETGFMRGRRTDGSFVPDFDPYAWSKEYTEASAFVTSLAVPHDPEGLAELHGGREAFLRKLDEFFEAPTDFRVGGYGIQIHEMAEMAAGFWGQCAISNQPSFHIPFLYAYFGETGKTSRWVERICKEGFSYRDDGFPGDEDNGSMAAWYVFAVLGFYPICPGRGDFISFRGIAQKARIVV